MSSFDPQQVHASIGLATVIGGPFLYSKTIIAAADFKAHGNV
jgi:hypothetical protein